MSTAPKKPTKNSSCSFTLRISQGAKLAMDKEARRKHMPVRTLVRKLLEEHFVGAPTTTVEYRKVPLRVQRP
jgi:hypothetical protein